MQVMAGHAIAVEDPRLSGTVSMFVATPSLHAYAVCMLMMLRCFHMCREGAPSAGRMIWKGMRWAEGAYRVCEAANYFEFLRSGLYRCARGLLYLGPGSRSLVEACKSCMWWKQHGRSIYI